MLFRVGEKIERLDVSVDILSVPISTASYYFANNPRNAEGNEAYVAAVWHYDFDVGFPIDLPLLQFRLANVPWARTFKHCSSFCC
jgi:hypothetical protein